MKLKNIKPYVLLIFLAIISCKKTKQSKESYQEFTIKGESILKEKFNTFNLHIMDSLILIKNISDKDGFVFSVHKNNKNFTHLLDFGKIGEGPNEFEMQADYTNQYNISNESITFWVYEMNRKKYSLINLTSTIQKGRIEVEKSIELPSKPYQDIFYLGNKQIVSNTNNLASTMQRLQFYDFSQDSILKTIGFTSNIENPKKNDVAFTQYNFNPIFLNSLRYNEKNKKLVSAMISMDEIGVFKTNGKVEFIIDKKGGHDEKTHNITSNLKIYNADVELTDKYIFVLYSGQFIDDYYKKELPVQIKVYNWDYKLKYIFNVEESLNFITVDQEENFLIGVSVNQEKVMRYDFKDSGIQ